MDEQEVVDLNNSGSYDYSKRKKKPIYYAEENLAEDTDGDGPDYIERRIGVHDEHNRHVKHLNVGGTLRTNSSGIIELPHQHLGSPYKKKKKTPKMRFTMDEPKKMRLELDIKSPKIEGFNIKKIVIPKAVLDDKNIKTNTGTFKMDYLKNWLKKVEFKRKLKKRGGIF